MIKTFLSAKSIDPGRKAFGEGFPVSHGKQTSDFSEKSVTGFPLKLHFDSVQESHGLLSGRRVKVQVMSYASWFARRVKQGHREMFEAMFGVSLWQFGFKETERFCPMTAAASKCGGCKLLKLTVL
jgi:hypothetical protein